MAEMMHALRAERVNNYTMVIYGVFILQRDKGSQLYAVKALLLAPRVGPEQFGLKCGEEYENLCQKAGTSNITTTKTGFPDYGSVREMSVIEPERGAYYFLSAGVVRFASLDCSEKDSFEKGLREGLEKRLAEMLWKKE